MSSAIEEEKDKGEYKESNEEHISSNKQWVTFYREFIDSTLFYYSSSSSFKFTPR